MGIIDEAIGSLRGAWLLFLDRPEGMGAFNLTVTGFWRSFGAIVLVLPLYLLSVLVERSLLPAPPGDFSEGAYWIARGAALALNWIALPVLLGFAARPLGIAASYLPFIIARNWASVVAAVPFAVAAAIVSMGEMVQEIGGIVTLAALFLVLRYNYIVARRALEAGIGFAIAITAIDFLLSLVIDAGVDRVFGIQ